MAAKPTGQTPIGTGNLVQDKIQDAITEAASRIQPFASAQLLWTRLTDDERDTLGGDVEKAYRAHNGTAGLLMAVRGYSRMKATLKAAHMLSFIDQQTYDWLVDATTGTHAVVEDQVELLAAKVALVVCENTRRAFWQGEVIEVDWHRYDKSWQWLVELAIAAKAGASIDREEFGESRNPRYLSQLKNRTRNLPGFPASLADVIKSAGRGTQRLDLKPDDVRLFRLSTDTVLHEVSVPPRLTS